MMAKFLFICVSLIYFSASGSDLKCFQYYKNAKTDNTSQQAVSIITLDSEIYSKTPDIFSGLRIINKKGQEVPFAIRKEFIKNIKEYQSSSPSTIENLKKIKNTVVITIKQKNANKSIDSIRIKTPSKNFEKEISVAGSNDGKNWHNIIKDRIIFDYSSIILLRKTSINIPASKYKYFRISIDNFSEEKTSPIHTLVKEKQSGMDSKEIISVIKRKTHIKISSVDLINVSKTKTNACLKKKDYPVKISTITTKNKRTVIKFYSAYEPLTTLSLSTSSTNFSRNILIQASRDNKKWYNIARSKWVKSNITKTKAKSGIVSFAESQYKYYKIAISNGDNPELENIKVTARGDIYRLVMLGRQDLELKLYYGGSARNPEYEIAELLPAIMNFNEIKYRLSKEKPSPVFDNSGSQEPGSYKWFFVMIIVLISIILVIILYKNLGKLSNIENSDINAESNE